MVTVGVKCLQVPYDTYDPSVYTRPVSIFSEEYRIFVDPDVLE